MDAPTSHPLQRMTLTAGQVAHLLGLSEAIFRKKRPELEALGFPTKLPGLATWSAPAVRRWIASNGNSGATIASDDPEIHAIVAELEADYTGTRQHEAA